MFGLVSGFDNNNSIVMVTVTVIVIKGLRVIDLTIITFIIITVKYNKYKVNIAIIITINNSCKIK